MFAFQRGLGLLPFAVVVQQRLRKKMHSRAEHLNFAKAVPIPGLTKPICEGIPFKPGEIPVIEHSA